MFIDMLMLCAVQILTYFSKYMCIIATYMNIPYEENTYDSQI